MYFPPLGNFRSIKFLLLPLCKRYSTLTYPLAPLVIDQSLLCKVRATKMILCPSFYVFAFLFLLFGCFGFGAFYVLRCTYVLGTLLYLPLCTRWYYSTGVYPVSGAQYNLFLLLQRRWCILATCPYIWRMLIDYNYGYGPSEFPDSNQPRWTTQITKYLKNENTQLVRW